jgi:hypothetical protein
VAARFSCDAAQTPAELPLRRLSRVQYTHSVHALVERTGLPAAERAAVLAALEPALARFPPDRKAGAPGDTHGGFTQLDQAVQQGHVDATYAVAVALGRDLTRTPARLAGLLGGCATDASTANDAECLTAFLRSFGAAALRRPLGAEDLAFYAAAAGDTPVAPEAVADVVALLLTAPQFLYHVEEAPQAPAQGVQRLDAWALAARLSFHFWQAPPDAALLQAAASGALLTEEGYRQQVQRLAADPRTDASLEDFFAQWLRLHEVQPLNTRVGTPAFDAFAGADRPAADLHLQMRQEVRDLVRHVARSGGPLSEVLTSRKSFARRADLAALYGPGQPLWDGTSAPPDLVQPERAGLLTRAAFLASPSGNTRPVMKGFLLRTALLCQSVPPPPDNAAATPLDLSPDLTTREQVEALTEQSGTSCRGCHRTLLNPLGFATENFDALGRLRTHQRLFGADGTPRGERSVDTRTRVVLNEEEHALAGAHDALGLMERSGDFERCFALQYFRFAFGRVEEPERDGCALAALQQEALAGRPLTEVLGAVALQPAFQRRDFQ